MQFDENRIGAAAVYCCDGRFGEHFDDFLHNALQVAALRPARAAGRAWLSGRALSGLKGGRVAHRTSCDS